MHRRAKQGIAGWLAISICVLLPIAVDDRPAQAALPAGFTDTVVWGSAQGLVNPSSIEFAANGEVFVGEQDGRIWSFASTNDPTPTLLVDLRPVVYTPGDHGIEDLAVHPDYPAQPYVYVQYSLDAAPGTTPPYYNDVCPNLNNPGCPVRGRISRLTVANGVAVGAEHVLLEAGCFHGPYHGPAGLAFGPDGYLYAASGEGARVGGLDFGSGGVPENPCGDPPGGVGVAITLPNAEGGSLRSQDLRTLVDPVGYNGSVVRIDPVTGAGAPDNPLAGSSDPQARRSIAYGLRNPWRLEFRPGTDDLWIGDVGQDNREELNRIAGVNDLTIDNFGWPCYEGTQRNAAWDAANATLCENLYAEGAAAVTAPRFEWTHQGQTVPGDGCSVGAAAVTGLGFYDGGPYPDNFDGALFFVDLVRTCLYVMYPDGSGEPNPVTTQLFASGLAGAADLEISPAGEIYYLSLFGCNCIRRLRYAAGNAEPVAVADADVRYGPLPLAVQFDAGASSDPENALVTYAWDLDGDGAFDDSTSAMPTRTYTEPDAITVGVRVTDPGGLSDTDTFVLRPGETPPELTVTAPTVQLFAVGDTIGFAASAVDDADGPLGASAFTWEVAQLHCNPNDVTQCHEHQFQSFVGTAAGSFVAPDHDLPSYLVARVRVTDSAGLSATSDHAILPLSHTIAMRSAPPGIPVGVNLTNRPSPFDINVIAQSSPSVTAAPTAVLGGINYEFVSWSDGGAPTHSLTPVNAPRTLTATYRPVPVATPVLASITEPAGGTGFIDVPIELSFATDRTVTIPWTTIGLTATTGTDFTAASGVVTITAGQTQGVARVTVRGDTLDENDELFLVSFQSATNAKLGGFLGLGFGLIVDDDPSPVILPTTASISEGNVGTKTIEIPVYLDRPSGRTVSAGFVTLPWSASQGSDFDPAWGTVTFAPGQTQTSVSVTVRADTIDEPDEVFFIWVVEPTNALVGGFSGIGVGQINDDD